VSYFSAAAYSIVLVGAADEQVEQLQRRAAAAASQLEDAPEDEDQRELEAFSQLRIVRELLQAAKRCFPTARCRDTVHSPRRPQHNHFCAGTRHPRLSRYRSVEQQ